MTERLLPVTEWPRLLALERGWLKQLPEAHEAVIFVVEDNTGEIVGYWMVLKAYHLEPVWIHPDHRGKMVPRRLWRCIRDFLDTCSITKAFCLTEQSAVGGYLLRLGLRKLPAAIYEFTHARHHTRG
jgi:GNAT superfamily N-acetyltransferase